ncbi:3-deoxy-D-manno-octulosonic acid transferase [Lichenibacterium ramalinae]|uniref:3-deoxy-D-manno-octulosonic acid transferase n=1 Tax=Lichenibacterium ramalinae TaxID=2316527 RepID=A0A4Q2RDV7_9HYPH|nr:3-deoxy-D-manno-octulosonic acid transferase [Lichenibacterium ramalinae]RYB05109.1 3-deoxy-D-manno-octulosonic acid transferase [Lichenibacterium ramalinae]
MTASPLFAAYRAATVALEPAGRPFLAWRLGRGKEDAARVGERLGHAGRPRPPGRLVWLHGASVGEGVSLLPLIDALMARGCNILLTTGTVNSARVLAGRLPGGVIHQFAPLDLPGPVRRFLGHWRPDLAVLAESELWPNLVDGLHRAAVPLVMVNARMSERSARRWSRAPGFIGALLGRTALCLCQSEADAARYRALGAARVAVAGLLKYDVPAPAADPEAVARFTAAVGPRPVWVAASTHADEEAALFDAEAALRRDVPDVLTVVAPRQPNRGAPLLAEAHRRGITAALRSRGDAIHAGTAFYIADTLGELGLWYRAADLVFVGNSLAAPGGGQNPIEAARLGCAVLHGPHVANFADVYPALDAAGGAAPVLDAGHLAEAVATLLGDPARLRTMARAAAEAVEGRGGATARTAEALAPYLGVAA